MDKDDKRMSLFISAIGLAWNFCGQNLQKALEISAVCLFDCRGKGRIVGFLRAWSVAFEDSVMPFVLLWGSCPLVHFCHAMWPAIVVDESIIHNRKGLNKISKEKSLPVQFFGSHDFARVKTKQVTPFLKGLLSSFHLKCTKPHFHQSLVESKA
ncbi:Histone-lysine N-methyltransferase ATX1 [Vitis vinifera]|nr:Histone-lysine N-methyltransferase ATX1 [Vitis vinifera]